MCSHEKRLRTCLLIVSLTIKFTLRMTRHLPIATFTHSLGQSLVSFVNSSMICSARASSDHPNTSGCTCPLFQEEGWYPVTLCQLPEPQQNHQEGTIPDPTHHKSS